MKSCWHDFCTEHHCKFKPQSVIRISVSEGKLTLWGVCRRSRGMTALMSPWPVCTALEKKKQKKKSVLIKQHYVTRECALDQVVCRWLTSLPQCSCASPAEDTAKEANRETWSSCHGEKLTLCWGSANFTKDLFHIWESDCVSWLVRLYLPVAAVISDRRLFFLQLALIHLRRESKTSSIAVPEQREKTAMHSDESPFNTDFVQYQLFLPWKWQHHHNASPLRDFR